MAAFNPDTVLVNPRSAAGTRASRFASLKATLALAGACALCALAQPACAALGGAPMATPDGATVTTAGSTAVTAPGQVAKAAAQASAASSSAAAAAYTVRQTTLANGTVVREYVSQAGTVFGVGWSGPQPPDLSALLGTWFPQYVAGVKAAHAAGVVRGPGVVEQPGLVVHAGGHMGAFSGQAWLPQGLPAGVSAADIQ